MKRRLLLLLAGLPMAAAWASPPAVTLALEWRWVDSAVAGAATAAVRDGAVVVGTSGSYSSAGRGKVTSTVAAPPPAAGSQRLLVRNGQRASVRLTTREPLQWTNAVVDLAPDGKVRGVRAQLQTGEREVVNRFAATPTWPGGQAPVRVEFSLGEDGREQESTVDLPLDRWQTVARSGGAAAAPAPGTLTSSSAGAPPQRELQLRVSLQP